MKVNKTFFALLTSLVLLTGCWGMTFKADTPNEYTQNKNMIESLYRSTQEDIIRELGAPAQIEKRNKSTFFIYQWKRSDKDIMFSIIPVPFPVPVPVAGGRSKVYLHCLFLEFDKYNLLMNHASLSDSIDAVHPWMEPKWETDCIDIFYAPVYEGCEGTWSEIQKCSEEKGMLDHMAK